MSKRNYFSLVVFAFLLTSTLLACGGAEKKEVEREYECIIPPPPRIEYGFLLDTFNVIHDTVQPGMTLSHLLAPYGISQAKINEADIQSKDTASMNYITAGKKYTILRDQKDTTTTYYVIYEKNRIEYVIFDFKDSVNITLVKRPVETIEKELTGVIKKNSNLVLTIKNSLNDDATAGELAETVAQIFAWTIDFFKLYPDDKFKIIYEEKQVEGVPYGIGQIKAVYFYNISQEYFAFRFEQDGEIGYFDENGKGMKRPFLKAPLKFSRISSGYTMKRFHPVQKVWKAHLGTDYAAATGTPIMATADGSVEAAGYSAGNGNYVKIYHNKTYQTAYLHMSKIESGMRKGVRVKQGQVIGYVGSTGLATGPHVCYRFWKNGNQIDPKSEKFSATEPIKEANKKRYNAIMEPLKSRLDALKYDTKKSS